MAAPTTKGIWDFAVRTYLQDANLNAEEKNLLRTTDASALSEHLRSLQERYQQKSVVHKSLVKIQGLFGGINKYAKALDVISNVQPMPFSVVWGVLRVVLQVLEGYEQYMEEIADMFERISDHLPHYDLYWTFYPGSTRLQEVLGKVFLDVISFCGEILRLFRKQTNQNLPAGSQSRVSLLSGSKMALKGSWAGFKKSFDRHLQNFKEHNALVEKEAELCEYQQSVLERREARAHREDQKMENAEASQFRDEERIARREEAKFREDVRNAHTASTAAQDDLKAKIGGHHRDAQTQWDLQATERDAANKSREKIENFITEEHFKAVRDWLSPLEMDHEAHLDRRQDGTCEWVFRDQDFLSWRDGSENLLWMFGIPGCGKTVFSSVIIEDLTKNKCEESSNNSLSYFFYSRDTLGAAFDSSGARAVNSLQLVIFKTLLWQICQRSRPAQSFLNEHRKEAINLKTAQQLLDQVLEHFQVNYIVFDGLDEMDIDFADAVMVSLSRIQNAKLLVSSRTGLGVKALRALKSAQKLEIHGEQVEKDIKVYVQNRVEDIGYRWSENLKLDVSQRLPLKSKSMFRLAECQMSLLEDVLTENKARSMLEEMPSKINDVYKSILSKVIDHHRTPVRRLLLWLATAREPLTWPELAEAIAVRIDSETPDSGDKILDSSSLLRSCGSLIRVSSRKRLGTFPYAPVLVKVISLAHDTVREFLHGEELMSSVSLLRYFALSEREAHLALSKVCLTYLNYAGYGIIHYSSFVFRDDGGDSFLRYASVHWYHHVRFDSRVPSLGEYPDRGTPSIEVEVLPSILRLLYFGPKMNRWAWLKILKWYLPEEFRVVRPEASDGALQFSAISSLPFTFSNLLPVEIRKIDIDRREKQANLIIVAMKNAIGKWFPTAPGCGIFEFNANQDRAKHSMIAFCLWTWIVDDSKFGVQSQLNRALSLDSTTALWKFSEDAIRLLLKLGYFPNVKKELCDKFQRVYPNLMACRVHEFERVNDSPQVLTCNIPEIYKPPCLHLEVFLQNIEGVRHLLENGYDASAIDYGFQTPLHIAFKKRNEEIISLLVSYGCDLFAVDGRGEGVVHEAVEKDDDRLVRKYLSLFNAAEVLAVDIEDMPPVLQPTIEMMISSGKCSSSFRAFLDHGMSPNIRDREYQRTILHWACRESGRIERDFDMQLRELAIIGVDFMLQDRCGDTALHTECRYSRRKYLVRTLLQYSTRADIFNKEGRLPLHIATSRRREAHILTLISFMRSRGCLDLISKPTVASETPLGNLCNVYIGNVKDRSSQVRIISALLGAGASVGTGDASGSSRLLYLIRAFLKGSGSYEDNVIPNAIGKHSPSFPRVLQVLRCQRYNIEFIRPHTWTGLELLLSKCQKEHEQDVRDCLNNLLEDSAYNGLTESLTGPFKRWLQRMGCES